MTKSAAIVAAVNAVLALVYAFGWSVSPEQQLAIVAAVNAGLVLIAVWRDPAIPFGNQS